MIGAVVLATDQGLGYLAKDFYDNGVVDKVLIQRHSRRKNHTEWYKDWKWLEDSNFDWFFENLEAIIYFEDPFNWQIIPKAREKGIKNVLMPMYECTRYPFPYEFDQILAVSDLDYQFYEEKNPIRINVPVPNDIKWKERKKAKVFVHNAGNGGLGGRNGTKELLEAMKYVKSPIKLILRTQEGVYKTDDKRVEIRTGTVPFEELYQEGDVFIFPEKFNGLSLPLQEAYASGMLVMATDRFPMNRWLPKEPLIPVLGYKRETITVEFDYAVIDPEDIAKKIDEWYGKDIIKYSRMGRKWAEENSWKKLKSKYVSSIKTLFN